MNNKEQLLTRGILNNDRKAYRLLYETYHASLFRFAETYVCCPGLSEDIVQEVFIKLWEESNLRIKRSLKSYLFLMVRNKCIDYLRSIHVEDKRKLKLMEAQINSDTIELSLDDKVTAEIKKAILELPAQCQQVYKMFVYDGLKYAEIALELDISIESVKVQVFRAKKNLRFKLAHLKELLILFYRILRR